MKPSIWMKRRFGAAAPLLLMFALTTVLTAALTTPLAAQEAETGTEEPPAAEDAAKAPPVLTLEAIEIEPSDPGVDTLCQLRVTVENIAERPVTALAFDVEIGGTKLPVYDRQLFLETLPPGKTTEIRLYNFWTTETGRPAPKDGKLVLRVVLREAQWVELSTEEDGTEVWDLGEQVPGLPVEVKLEVGLGGAGKKP